MYSSTKAIQLAKDLDNARSKGHWQTISELARRYKKYSNDSVLENIAIAEANLQLLVNNNCTPTTYKMYSNDAPGHITCRPSLQPDQIKPFLSQLNAAIHSKSTTNLDNTQNQFAKIIKARCYFECGNYETTLSVLNDLSLNTRTQLSIGYGSTLCLQAAIMEAISLELTGSTDKAVTAYQTIVDMINTTVEITDRTLVDWSEEGLYRGSLFLLGHRNMDNVTITGIHEILRTYQKITSSQPIHWRTHKRAVITRYSLDYISSSYRENQYCPPPPTDPSVEMDDRSYKAYEKEMFIVELSHLHTIYERIVYSLVSFPHSGDSNPMIYEMVDRLADDMELIDDSPVELRNYIEMLNRATQRTFNSSRITRHLFHALVRLGDFKEAEHALTSYLYLVGLQSQVTRETKDWGDAITIDKHGRASTIPFMNESLLKQLAEDALSESMLYTDKRYDHVKSQLEQPDAPINARRPSTIASRRTDDKESVESIVNVLIAGVRMYCKYLRKGTEAVELAELAKIVLEVTGANNIIGSRLGGIVYRYLGVAYGLMASDTTDPEIRPTYHELAKKYLQQSITLDDKAWETHYQLAKQLAEMRDITDAFQSVAKSLEINPNHLPSWHLLVLLYSCPKQDDVFKALKVCELGLDEAKSLQLEWADDSEGYEQQLLLKLTHMLLVEIAQGTEAALVCQEEVFSMYGKLTMMDPEMTSSGSDTDGGVGGSDSFTSRRELVVSGSLGNICDTGNTTNNLSQPTGGEASLTVPTEQPVSSSSNGITTINSSLSSTSMQQPLKSTVNATRTSDPSGQSSMPSEKTNSHQNISNGRKALVGYPVSLSVDQDQEKQKRHSLRNILRKKKKNQFNYHVSYSANDVSKKKESLTSFHSVSTSLPSNQSIFQSTIPRKPQWTKLRRHQIQHILCLLWMTSAGTFLRQGRLDEALKAVEEAEKVNWTSEPHVWCLLGQVRLGQSRQEEAIEAFQKGLVADPNDTLCRLWLAKTFMEMGDLVVSEGILNNLTRGKGWNHPEAWYHLGDLYNKTNRMERAKNCLFYALELEDTEPIQPFSILPRCI